MPYLIFAVLLTIVQANPPVPRKAADKPASTSNSVKQAATNKEHSPNARVDTPTVTESNQDKGQSQSAHNAGETIIVREPAAVARGKDGWDKAYVIATVALVFVGACGVRYAIKSLRIIESQAGIMQDQLKTMGEQVAEMRSAGQQTNTLIERAGKQVEQLAIASEAASKSADAAVRNAQAAKESADAVVSSERAWVLVNRVANSETWYDPHNPAYTPGMIFEFKVFGRTPAKLVKTIFHFDNVPAKPGTQPPEPDLPLIPEYKSPGPTTEIPEEGRIVAPGGSVKITLWFRQQLTEEQWVKLRDGQTLMCAYGIIKYEDAFRKERETKVCYVYRFTWGGVITAPDKTVLNPSEFRIGGPTAYNKAT